MKIFRTAVLAVASGFFGAVLALAGQAVLFPVAEMSLPQGQPLAAAEPFRAYARDDPQGRLVGIGEVVDGEWREYITFKKRSRLKDVDGNPAMVLHNLPEPHKTVELGFYNFGPTMVTDNEIIEFFIGNSRTGAEYGALSVRSVDGRFGGMLQIRNHADTHSIMIDNRAPNFSNREVVTEFRDHRSGAMPFRLMRHACFHVQGYAGKLSCAIDAILP